MPPPPSEPIDPATPTAGRERAWPWLVALATAGAILGVLPHLAFAARTGDPAFIPDGDGLLYLAWSQSIVRHGGWAMTDAVHRPSGAMMHPWLLFVPPARIARALGLGILPLGIVWRLIAGPAMALGIYAVVRPHARSARGAAGLAAFLLFDAGFLFGQVVYREQFLLGRWAQGLGGLAAKVPHLMPHLRVPTPALALPFLLVHFALVDRARRRGTTGSALAAGVSLGVLYHVFFYFATAATLGTILAWLVDRDGRRAYARMLAVAAVVGGPALLEGIRIKGSTSADWLVRTDKFVPVDRFDPGLLLLPRALIAGWIASAWFIFRGRRDLIYLWCCTLAGLALANQHVVTGFQLENFHWIYAFGTAFSLLLASLVVPWAARAPGWRWAAPALLAAQVALGTTFRVVESTGSSETREIMDRLGAWRREGFAIPPGSVVAGPPDLLLLLGGVEDVDVLGGRLVEYSSMANDAERDERDALDLVLIGLPREAYDREFAAVEHLSDVSRAWRLANYDAIRDDPNPLVDRFRVSIVLVPRSPPGLHPPAALGERAHRVREGTTWDLWRIDPPRAAPAP